MKKWWEQLKEEYYETRFNSNEDWMEWFIKRKMTWGWRWPTAITIFVLWALSLPDARNAVRFFYFLLALGVATVLHKLISYLKRRK
ncbi:hypothetical protein F6P74_10050 [Streptococcus suis]|uniref:Membrane protein n=2 Tax=Streptococcus suis TaxID=1307 RepID=A0A0Z8GUT6_STRSU|nr:hypothetical protein [Streptococcus suis]MBS8071851.1 hypothetical protein [Streptococcus suis]MBS8095332.1 hypothetical protein [Streptococcus suis]MBS8104140.1 hypothetical protein [Streptococcus suis]MBY4977097.1 hypothetical protein [Streptococcus suis]MBY4981440.1 hypothetical protein [Streptococcus suis]